VRYDEQASGDISSGPRAGSVVALELLEHLEKVHTELDLKAFFAALCGDIEADRAELDALVERVGASASTLRAAIAWFSEKATRIKLQMDDTGGGDRLRGPGGRRRLTVGP
jgi:hypothetical protein